MLFRRRGIGRQGFQGIGQFTGRFFRDQDAGLPVHDGLRDSSDTAGDDRQSHGHSLQNGQAKPLAARRLAIDIRAIEDVRHIADHPAQTTAWPAPTSAARSWSAWVSDGCTVSADLDESHSRGLPRQNTHGPQQHIHSLNRIVEGHAGHDHILIGKAEFPAHLRPPAPDDGRGTPR